MAKVCAANVRFEPEITVWTGGIWHYGLLTLVTRCIDICTEYFVRRASKRNTSGRKYSLLHSPGAILVVPGVSQPFAKLQ